jgi:hypothetical protein
MFSEANQKDSSGALPDSAFLVDTATWKADKETKDEDAANSTTTAEKVVNDALGPEEKVSSIFDVPDALQKYVVPRVTVDESTVPKSSHPGMIPDIVPGDVIKLEPDIEELFYVGTMGKKVSRMDGMENLTNITSLVLRSNNLTRMGGMESMTKLVHLELYDNQIKKMRGVETLVNLEVLDVSYNAMRDITDLSHMARLQTLYFAQNKLTKIDGVGALSSLAILDLGANRIREIENLNTLTQLKELWLGKNKIEKIQNIDKLVNLEKVKIYFFAYVCFE